MNNKKILLIIGCGLLGLGLFNKLPWFNGDPIRPNVSIDISDIKSPSDDVKKEALEVVQIFKNAGSSSRNDAIKLRDLYLDLAKLISLDGEETVIKNTEEIRQANSIAGAMFRLDAKNKYPNLAQKAKDVVVSLVGEDQVNLSPELRNKAVEAFNVLAWACNEGTK